MVKDTSLYETLNLTPTATASEIRKSYYVLALKYHPDKLSENASQNEKETATAKFQAVSVAYKLLSDENSRKRYDLLGLEGVGLGTDQGTSEAANKVDPYEVFKMLFGGDKFLPLIGNVSLGKLFADMANDAESSETTPGSSQNRLETLQSETSQSSQSASLRSLDKEQQEAKAKEFEELQKARIEYLSKNLIQRLSLFTMSNNQADVLKSSFYKATQQEAEEELKNESHGPELLALLGYVYSYKANAELNKLGGGLTGKFSSMWSNLKDSGRMVSQVFGVVSAVRSLSKEAENLEKKQATIETSGTTTENINLNANASSPELELKMIKILWKVTSLDIEGTLKRVIPTVLKAEEIPGKEERLLERKRRATALAIIGGIYSSVGKAALKERQNAAIQH